MSAVLLVSPPSSSPTPGSPLPDTSATPPSEQPVISDEHRRVLQHLVAIEFEIPNLVDRETIATLENAGQVCDAVASALAEHCEVTHDELGSTFQTIARMSMLNVNIMIRMAKATTWREFCSAIPQCYRQACGNAVVAGARIT